MHMALLAYINSSFLSQFIGEKFVGFVFIAGAVLSMILLERVSDFLNRVGNFNATIIFLFLEIASLLGLAFFKTGWLVIPIFVFQYALLVLLGFNFDVFVEHFSSDKITGGIRGAFMAIMSGAWVISPIIVGAILSDSDFWKIYFISALVTIPVLAIIYFNLRDIKEVRYEHPPFWKTLRKVRQNVNVYRITIVGLFLNLFFAWMVIYVPIYLNQHIGFSWDKIGIILTIALLPYMLFEFPLGKLADHWYGEKEFLTIGFLIMAGATGAMTFITSSSIVVWIVVLFLTRVGGSFAEIMSESYFFKQIDSGDINIISFFRNNRPVAYIMTPIIAMPVLYFFPYQYVFLALAVLMLFGVYYSLTLKDTK